MEAAKINWILSILAEEQRIGEINDALTHIILCELPKQGDVLSDDELGQIAAARAGDASNPTITPSDKEKF